MPSDQQLFFIQNQKKSLQLKYLLQMSSDQNQEQLKRVLNKIYPFTEYPIDRPPPIELIQSEQKKLLCKNVNQQLQKYAYVVVTGGLSINKRRHQFIENHFLSNQTKQDIFFTLDDPQVTLNLLANSCILRIHNIWIQMAKNKKKTLVQDYIKSKLLAISFFANLEFEQFSKCCKKAEVMILGPKDVLLKKGDIPYHMYIVAEGQLVFERKIDVIRDNQLWTDFKNQLQRQQDNTSQLMLNHLVKQPKSQDETFEVQFRIKNVKEGQIICTRETLLQEKLNYSIVSTLKTKLITLKYPDLYNLKGDRLAEIRSSPAFEISDKALRKDYFYQTMWDRFKQQTQRESRLNKLEKQKFEDFLRKRMNMNPQKSYYCANKVGQGNIIDNPAGRISKLKFMSYQQKK